MSLVAKNVILTRCDALGLATRVGGVGSDDLKEVGAKSLEELFANSPINRRYSVGGNVAWIATEWNADFQLRLGSVQTFLGQPSTITRSSEPGPFGQAIQRALDPALKFS